MGAMKDLMHKNEFLCTKPNLVVITYNDEPNPEYEP